ncbi:MAG: prepilin peptidase [Merismopediaceae bacterium]|nr:prepilin peptidase [Merismopediaceae bacterium]
MDFWLAVIFLPFVFAFGASVGSFINVVAYRLPARLSLIQPPSRCPHCLHLLGRTENVPVLGWLWLRGKCRWCQTAIAPRYPVVEAITGVLFSVVFWQFGPTGQAIGYWGFVSWLLALSLIDWDTMTLPGGLTKSGLVLGVIFQGYQGWVQGSFALGLFTGIGGAVLGLWFFDLVRWAGTLWLGQEAMGDGDPKLAAMIGAWLGIPLLLLTAFVACALGTITGGIGLITGGLGRRQGFPFGPFLAIGALFSLLWGEKTLELYRQIFLQPF